uniref:Major facilitator superfamily (MFS) profile domain-containing protein n=1 Tax=Clastoptera arizonana TaxID=38151 RepID=A0A1B6C2J0_9HEMI
MEDDETNDTEKRVKTDECSECASTKKGVNGVVTFAGDRIINADGSEITDRLLRNVKSNSSSVSSLLSMRRRSIVMSPTSDKHIGNGKGGLHVQFDHKLLTPPNQVKLTLATSYTSTNSGSSSSSYEDDSSSGNFSDTRAPDGGWGWVVVFAAFMVNLIADGITFSFGVIFVEFLHYFGEGKSKTAWIGSLFMAMPLLSGPVASFLTDRYGCRKVCIVGGILSAAGFIVSSFTNSMELLFLTFGVIAGFGLSLCYVAAVVIVAYYFDRRRSFATGLSVCGSGIGTFLFAPLTNHLLAEYGWRGTTLILAGLFLNLCVFGMMMRDLAWTKTKTVNRSRKKRKSRINNTSSADSFSAQSATQQTPTSCPSSGELRKLLQRPGCASPNESTVENEADPIQRQCSSLVNLPTFVRNEERVPLEVLEMLTTHKHLYAVLLHNYPNLLISSRSFSDSGRLHEQTNGRARDQLSARFVANNMLPSPLTRPSTFSETPTTSPTAEIKDTTPNMEEANIDMSPASHPLWLAKRHPHLHAHKHTRLPTASYLKDLRVHRHSLTYRGAMLNINRYRLRASSCPDIYRNSMTTIAKEKVEWYAGLWELWYLLADMLDLSHFSNIRFLLFAISNFLLYTWYDVPYVYLADNAIEMGINETDASFLISVIGILNMIGEIALGWAGDKAWVNAGLVYATSMALCGAVVALIPIIKSYQVLSVVSGAFGLFIAANYSLTSIILVEVITLERFTNAYGLLLLVQGVANLIGPPLAGWLYDITGSYDLSFYLAGIFIALSGVLLVVLPSVEKIRSCRKKENVAEKNEPPIPVKIANHV